jgi:hypothetical protein
VRAKRIVLTLVAFLTFGLPAAVAGSAAWTAVPRETCRWRDSDFCSDYGAVYGGFCALFAAGLLIALWLIHKQRPGT